MVLYGRRKKQLAQSLHRQTQKASVRASECLVNANIRTIKMFGCEEREADKFDAELDATLEYAEISASADGIFMGGLSS